MRLTGAAVAIAVRDKKRKASLIGVCMTDDFV